MSVLVSKMVCLGRHDPHKQKLGGVFHCCWDCKGVLRWKALRMADLEGASSVFPSELQKFPKNALSIKWQASVSRLYKGDWTYTLGFELREMIDDCCGFTCIPGKMC